MTKMMTCSTALATVLILAGAGVAAAQTDLFGSIGSDATGGLPPPTIIAAYPVTLNLTGLETNPATLDVDLPNIGIVTATRVTFETLEGYDGADVPLPGNTTPDLSYRWVGRTASQGIVSLGVSLGTMSAYIWEADETFSIRHYDGSTHLVHNALDDFPTMFSRQRR